MKVSAVLKISLLLLILSPFAFSKTKIIVSVIPQKIFVEKIAKDKAEVTVMVKQGSSPHNYQPKPSQMKELTQASVYFSMGVEFENVWLEKFHNQNKKMLIKNLSDDINKTLTIHEHHNAENELDPHIWVDPLNVKIMAKNIYETLIKIDAKNKEYYKKNYEAYLKELDSLDANIKEILKDTPDNAIFMVFHPAWGYFAKRYNLTQLPIEVEGKAPKMKALIGIIKKAKETKVRAIFTQPEFSDKASQNIARNLKIEVIKASPLAENWAENLQNLAKAIAKKR